MAPIRCRLVIAVAPRLLGEALCRVLTCEQRDVVVVVPGAVADGALGTATGADFDIAVVSADEQDLSASVVIRLPDSPALGMARVGGEPVPMEDLGGLVALVERYCAALGSASTVDNGV